jgi:integrase
MFTLGKQAKKVNEIPYIPMLTESNVRTGFFEYSEFVAVRDALPSPLKALMTFAYYTGCRVDEIRQLVWAQVNLVKRTVTLNPTDTKNEEGRTLIMGDELLTEIRELHSNRHLGCPYVFQRDGQQIKDFRVAWKNACIKAGLFRVVTNPQGKEIKVPSKIFHDLRRTAVRDMVRSSVPERVAMRISGHKTRSVFDRYNIVSDKDLEEAAKAREKYLEQQKATAVPLDQRRGEIIPLAQNG